MNYFNGRRKPMMANFYQMQRKRLGVLIDDAGALLWVVVGVLTPTTASDFPRASVFPTNHPLELPVDHLSAHQWLDTFLEHRLAGFGTYEDAISSQHRVMWHSVLTRRC